MWGYTLEGRTLVKEILDRDRKLLMKDFNSEPVYGPVEGDTKIIADFTEYSPLHMGHRHCMREANIWFPKVYLLQLYPDPWREVAGVFHTS